MRHNNKKYQFQWWRWQWYIYFFFILVLLVTENVHSLPRPIRSNECGEGAFINTDGLCEPCLECDSNSVDSTPCTKTSDAICGPCKQGFGKWNYGCVPCQYRPDLEECRSLLLFTKQVLSSSADNSPTTSLMKTRSLTNNASPSPLPHNTINQEDSRLASRGTEGIDVKIAGPVIAALGISSICSFVFAMILYCKKKGFCKSSKSIESTGQKSKLGDCEESTPAEKGALILTAELRGQESQADGSQIKSTEEKEESILSSCQVQFSKSMDSLKVTVNPRIIENRLHSTLSKSTSGLLRTDSDHAFKVYDDMYKNRQEFKQDKLNELYVNACIKGKSMDIQSINYDIREKIQEEMDKFPDCWRKFGNYLIKNDRKVILCISNSKQQQKSFTEQVLDYAQSNGKTVEDLLVALNKLDCVQNVLSILCDHVIPVGLSKAKNGS